MMLNTACSKTASANMRSEPCPASAGLFFCFGFRRMRRMPVFYIRMLGGYSPNFRRRSWQGDINRIYCLQRHSSHRLSPLHRGEHRWGRLPLFISRYARVRLSTLFNETAFSTKSLNKLSALSHFIRAVEVMRDRFFMFAYAAVDKPIIL